MRDPVAYVIGVAPLPIRWYSEVTLLPSVVVEIRGELLRWRGFGFRGSNIVPLFYRPSSSERYSVVP